MLRSAVIFLSTTACCAAQECVPRSASVGATQLARHMGIESLLERSPGRILKVQLQAGGCRFSKIQKKQIQDLTIVVTVDVTKFLQQHWYERTDEFTEHKLNRCSPIWLERRDWSIDTSGQFRGFVRLRSHWKDCEGLGVTIRRPSADISITAKIEKAPIKIAAERKGAPERVAWTLTPVLTKDPSLDFVHNELLRLFVAKLRKSTEVLVDHRLVVDSCPRKAESLCFEPVGATFTKPDIPKTMLVEPRALGTETVNPLDPPTFAPIPVDQWVLVEIPTLWVKVTFRIPEADALDANGIEDLFSRLAPPR